MMDPKAAPAEADYKVFQQPDMTFGVRVTIPDSYPTTITSFATEAAAIQWIAEHKEKVRSRAGMKRRWTSGFQRKA